MIDSTTARKILFETIAYGIRHGEYDQSVEIARLSQIFMSGEGQAQEFLLELRENETEVSKKLRVKVTKPITPLALAPVKTNFQKMFRVDGTTFDIDVPDDNDGKARLANAIDTYYSGNSLTEYGENRFLLWVFNDPNGWHIVERRNAVNDLGVVTGVDVFPLEVSSQQAVNVGYDNGSPVWLVVEHERMELSIEQGKVKEKKVSDFYHYSAGLTVKYSEFINPANAADDSEIIDIQIDSKNTRRFVVEEFQTNSTEFPGQKWGCFDDPAGSKTLKVPPYWEGARQLLERLIRNDSIYQVSVYNHVFPKLFHYDYKCNHVDDNHTACEGGYMGGNANAPCPKCKGSGGVIHVSESDTITFDLPDSMEDMSKLPELSKLAYYHQPPLDVTEALYQWTKDLLEWVYMASFNVSNVEKAVVQRTATEVDMLNDNINARVLPCLKQYGAMCERVARVSAQYLEIGDKVKVAFIVPADMRLEGLDVLVDRYNRMKTAGLSYEAIWTIHCAILNKTHTGNQAAVENIKAWEFWKPFKSYDQNLALLILQNRAGDDPQRLLYENWDFVKLLVEIGLDGKAKFYELPRQAQKKLIDASLLEVGSTVKVLDMGQDGSEFPDLTADDEQQNDNE
jgi:hypothetical protein